MNAVRLLTTADLDAALELSALAGWNQTAEDWARVIALEPGGAFCLESGGRLVATTIALRYGTALAWIGMVLTHPDERGRGHARRLMQHALDWLSASGVRVVKLDATDMGRPLYGSLGFADETPIERWSGVPAVPPGSVSEGAPDLALDGAAFGVDRSAVLAALAQSGPVLAHRDGFALSRLGRLARFLGPCVARTPAAARELISAALAQHPGERWFWDVLLENVAARELAESLGFAPVRRLVRMVTPAGATLSNDDTLVYAAAGFEFG